jgi:cytochrome c553
MRRRIHTWSYWLWMAALAPICTLYAASPKTAMQGTGAGPPCDACHGAYGEGMAAAHVPRLTGQSAEYLKKQLDNFADGSRDSPVMSNFAKALTEERRLELAARYAGMSAAYAMETVPPFTGAQLARGHKLAYQGDQRRQVQACNSCHGPDGSGVLHAAPYLAGQSSEYIASALKAFQSDTRKNDAGELMRSMAKHLNEIDILAVSGYFAQAGAANSKASSAPMRSP